MHHVNNVVIMQTEQLGWIKALEEELHSLKVKMVEMEQKMMEQDRVIAQLVGDNLNHLHVRATLPPSMLFADRVLLRRGYSISTLNALVETVSKYKGLH